MRLALEVIVLWCVGSVPLALLVGKCLRLRSENELPGLVADDVDVRYWSVADLSGEVEECTVLAFESRHVGAVEPAQRELSSV